ncbi:ISAs1 family transposase [Streptomyces shenzhenensis]|uniref:ISAs1 family transposase n=1 Tax=Streptomyces shenzhenensis TaxID=943815 RepID=UPI0015F03B16|nr:ISAs1 family transposase [Streptomyces shenzhenensis]
MATSDEQSHNPVGSSPRARCGPLDGDAFDDAVGAWLARYVAGPVDEPGDTLVGVAVDGKTVRGSRADGQAVHLLAAALHACQTVIAQRQIAARSNEIPAFAPLLDQIDPRGVVVTADAMHTQRAHAEHVIAASGHCLLVVEGNQKKLRKQLRRLTWRQIPLQARTTGPSHGRGRSAVCRSAPSGQVCSSRTRSRPWRSSAVAPTARPARSRRGPSADCSRRAISRQSPHLAPTLTSRTRRAPPTACA